MCVAGRDLAWIIRIIAQYITIYSATLAIWRALEIESKRLLIDPSVFNVQFRIIYYLTICLPFNHSIALLSYARKAPLTI